VHRYKNGIVCEGTEKGKEPINTAVFSRNPSLTFELELVAMDEMLVELEHALELR